MKIRSGFRAIETLNNGFATGCRDVCFCIAFVGCGLLMGCAHFQSKPQGHLSQVAKGWCLNIRASQVIPVYPLSEDVRVGDMYIVQYPIEDEVALYENEGFLPLTHQIGRLSLPSALVSSQAINPTPTNTVQSARKT